LEFLGFNMDLNDVGFNFGFYFEFESKV
jgi:hypothetical protein